MKSSHCGVFLSLCFLSLSAADTTALTREEAVRLALDRNPAARAAEQRAEAAALAAKGAGRWLNPGLSVEFENVGGDAPGASAMETTARLSQEIPLGGEKGALKNAARSSARRAAAESDGALAGLVAAVRAAFDRAMIAAVRDSLGAEALQLADSALFIVRSRVEAGDVSPAEGSRAGAALGRVQNEAERFHTERLAAVHGLLAFWGETSPDPPRLEGRIGHTGVPGLDSLSAWLEASPEIRAAGFAVQAATSRVDVERGEGFPDLTIAAGIRRAAADGRSSYLFELSAPLPLFDRRGSVVKSARAEAEAIRLDEAALKVTLHERLRAAHRSLENASGRLERLEQDVIPGAEEAHAAILAGYDSGKFGYLDLVEARREWIDSRMEKLATLDEVVTARLELESLVGKILDP